MTNKEIRCTSCHKMIDDQGVVFKCPECGKQVTRCHYCKKLGVKYKCVCGFEGP